MSGPEQMQQSHAHELAQSIISSAQHRQHVETDSRNGIYAISSANGLLRLDVGCLDDWPPFLDLGLLQSGERFGRLLLAR